MTEVTQVNGVGTVGVRALGLPQDPEPVWNWMGLMPPGMLANYSNKSFVFAGQFSHLMPYNYLNDLSPYGMATPNRQGFGVEGEVKVFGGLFVPKAGFDMASNSSPVPVSPTSRFWITDNLGNTFAATANPFSYARMRAGMDVNFKLFWPVKLSGGWTSNDTRNGQDSWVLDSSGKKLPFAMTSTLLQGGIEIHPSDALTFACGYQHVDANGFSDVIKISTLQGVLIDQLAYSIYWYITENARVDLLYETMVQSAPGVLNSEFEADSGLLRFQVKF
jgi:hypothetical protein